MNEELRSLNEDHTSNSSSLKGFKRFLAYVKKAFKDTETKEELGNRIVEVKDNPKSPSAIDAEELQDVFDTLMDDINEEENPTPQTIVPNMPKRKTYFWYSVAAAVVLIIAATLVLYLSLRIETNQSIPHRIYATKAGQKSTITLADGSVVRLNASSKLTYPQQFDDSIRAVALEGEAYFEIAKNKNKPFIIRSNGSTIRVLGTSFNVNSFNSDKTVVTVVTGKVNVASDRVELESVVLSANQQGVVQKDGIGKKDITNTERFLAWTEGKLVFDEMKMSEVVSILERWYGVEITLQDDMNDCFLEAEFEDVALKEVLDLIMLGQSDFKYAFAREADQVHVTINGKGCK